MGQAIEARDHARGLETSEREQSPAEQHRKVYEEWKREWDALTDEISAAWNTDKSAAEIVSEMRR